MRVDGVLDGLPGVLATRVSVSGGRVTVLYDARETDAATLAQAFEGTSYRAGTPGPVRAMGVRGDARFSATPGTAGSILIEAESLDDPLRLAVTADGPATVLDAPTSLDPARGPATIRYQVGPDVAPGALRLTLAGPDDPVELWLPLPPVR